MFVCLFLCLCVCCRWFQASFWLNGGWVCMWRWRCLDFLWTPEGKRWRPKPLRTTTPSTQFGTKSRSSSKRWDAAERQKGINAEGSNLTLQLRNLSVNGVTGDSSYSGVSENCCFWGRREVYWSSDYSSDCHKTRLLFYSLILLSLTFSLSIVKLWLSVTSWFLVFDVLLAAGLFSALQLPDIQSVWRLHPFMSVKFEFLYISLFSFHSSFN